MRPAQTVATAPARSARVQAGRTRLGTKASGRRGGARGRIGESTGGPGWRSRRAGWFSSGWLALLRARRSGALLGAVALGILVAVVLICTVPLFNTLVSDIQLRRELAAA